MSHVTRSIEEGLDTAPLEDVFERLLEAREELAETDADALSELEKKLYDRAWSYREWRDAKKGARALRFCVDVASEQGFADGDTTTSLLIRAIELDPHDDALVLDYLGSVADTDYRYADRSLLDVARSVSSPERAQRLALLDTLAEYWVLRAYLDPPGNVYVEAMQRSFAGAAALGASESSWLDARRWVLDAISFATVPEDIHARYAPRG